MILDENKLLSKVENKYSSIKNITPNGVIVPKNEFGFEFNLIVRSYVKF